MPNTTSSSSKRRSAAHKAIKTRKKNHPGGSLAKLSADDVQSAFANRKTFSTGDIMKKFGAAVGNATAITAVLRRRGLAEKTGTSPDGTSSWKWISAT